MATIRVQKLHTPQQEVVAQAKRFNVLMCGRRFGKTTLGIERAVDAIVRGLPVGWFAPTYKLLLEVWREMELILAPVTIASSVQERQIRVVGGGVIDFWSLDNPDAGRGRKYGRVIVDEAGIVRDLESAWQQSIRPTLADLEGDAWFLGTPKGRRYFWVLYQRGQSGDAEWASWRFPTGFNPYINPSELDAARRDMPESAYRQEFEGHPADDSGNPFDQAAIVDCTGPLGARPAVARGVDVAKAVDWTVDIGLNAEGAVCHFERYQRPWQETEQDVAAGPCVPTIIDSTGVGDPIVEALQRRSSHITGLKFTSTSKQQLMEGLRSAIQRREIRFPPGPIRDELESFEYTYTPTGVRYSAPTGAHDDCVVALALAVKQWDELGYGKVRRPDIYDVMFPPSPAELAVAMREECELWRLAREDAKRMIW